MVEKVDAELELLRDFYGAWLAFHAIDTHPKNRHPKEIAAQRIVDCVQRLKNMGCCESQYPGLKDAPRLVVVQ